MFSRLILHSDAPASSAAIISTHGSATWDELRQMTELLRRKVEALAKRRLGLIFRGAAKSYAALAALDQLQSDCFLLDPQLSNDELARRAANFRLGVIFDPCSCEEQKMIQGLPCE